MNFNIVILGFRWFQFTFLLFRHLYKCEGLRYDDLFDPYYDLDIKEALNRLPREVVDARNQRLKRAMNLSMKHEYLPEHMQAMQTPLRSYLQDMLALVKRENAELEALGALPLYQCTIP